MNYRLGMPGWTASPEEDMDANVGVHDTVAAVEWTKKYISLFGGDPAQITVMGESAGAGIVNVMVTGNGGKGDCPFQQVSQIHFAKTFYYRCLAANIGDIGIHIFARPSSSP